MGKVWRVIFKGTGDSKPYPNHQMSSRDWAAIPPRQLRLDQITTVTRVLELDRLLAEESTFFGDLFPHVVGWRGELYLEDGLHRVVRSALRNRTLVHARVLDLDVRARQLGINPEPQANGSEAPPQAPAQPAAPHPAPAAPMGAGWVRDNASASPLPQRPDWAPQTPPSGSAIPERRAPRHRRADDPDQ